MSEKLVFIGPLWGTPELLKEIRDAFCEIERVAFRQANFGECIVNETGQGLSRVTVSKTQCCYPVIIRRPTWTWCENPNDEMARLRPRCEVRDNRSDEWLPATLLAALSDWTSTFAVVRPNSYPTSYNYCRVRLDAQGQVLVDWEGEE
jgi:hypothetical protein